MERLAKTGTWASQKPALEPERCNGCLYCWLYCPGSAVTPQGDKIALRLELCKGCGICVMECPQGALRMEEIKAGHG